MDLVTLRTAVKSRVVIVSGNALLDVDSILNEFVNSGARQFDTEHPWPWMEASTTFPTVSGTGSYAVPAAYLETQALRWSDDKTLLERRPLKVVLEEQENGAGWPSHYAVHAGLIYVSPVPGSVRTVEHFYRSTTTVMTDDTDEPMSPSQWHPAIAEYAAYLAHRREDDLAAAGACLAAYDRWVAKAKRWADPAGGTSRVRVRAGSPFGS